MKMIPLSIFLSALVLAQDKPKDPPKPPVIPAEHQAEYWRSQNAVKDAQLNMIGAQRAADESVAQLTRDCGDKAGPSQDPADPKKLACVARPDPVKAENKK